MKSFTGRVKSGAGKARRNIARAVPLFRRVTGLTFYPGTLNLILDRPVRFENQIRCRTWGLCPVEVNGVSCWAVRSLKKNYARPFIEIVAPFRLRERLSLSDGDTVSVQISEAHLADGP